MDHLVSTDLSTKGQAIWDTSRNGDASEIAQMLELLEDRAGNHPDVPWLIIHALVEWAPATIDPMLSCLGKSPLSRGGRDCACALGEIALNQRKDRDPRILPALLRVVRASLAEGTPAPEAVCGVRYCAEAAPIPEASQPMLSILHVLMEQKDVDSWVFEKAVEVVLRNDPTLKEKIDVPAFDGMQHLRSAVASKNMAYGNQLSKEAVDKYEELVQKAIDNGRKIHEAAYSHQADFEVGVDIIGGKGTSTYLALYSPSQKGWHLSPSSS